MRILQVSARYLPFGGGTEMHTHEVARRLISLGHDVSVLTTDVTGSLAPTELVQSVPVRRVSAKPAGRDYFFSPDLYREVKQHRADVVHVQGYHTLVAPTAMLAAARSRTPYVTTFHSGGHSSRFRARLRPAQWWALRPLFVRAGQLVAVSQFEARLIAGALRLPPQRIRVVPNGADMPRAERPNAVEDDVDHDLVVSIGRLERYKGHQEVIAALPSVLTRRPDVRLRVLGSGPYEPELRALSRELGIERHVEIGGIPGGERARVAELLSRAALVVSMSYYEAHSIAALEAAYLGRPMLVRASTGLKEIADRGLARGVAAGADTETLAQAMLEELDQPRRPPTFQLPTWDDCVAQLLEIYASVAPDRTRPA